MNPPFLVLMHPLISADPPANIHIHVFLSRSCLDLLLSASPPPVLFTHLGTSYRMLRFHWLRIPAHLSCVHCCLLTAFVNLAVLLPSRPVNGAHTGPHRRCRRVSTYRQPLQPPSARQHRLPQSVQPSPQPPPPRLLCFKGNTPDVPIPQELTP
jgi:hypothetical protein